MLIPYPKKRKREMAAYSKHHYGQYKWRLNNPKLIVEHYAAAGSISSIFNTFAPDRPDVEFHQLPGVCAHFAVSATGAIYKFVPISIRCRHVVASTTWPSGLSTSASRTRTSWAARRS